MTSTVTAEEIDRLARELSNWGRWGAEDEVGTLNLITDAKRVEAAACVRSGAVYSLAIELRSDLPQPLGSGRLNPQHLMTMTGLDATLTDEDAAYADDAIALSTHAATHWDALAHVFHGGWMYNHRPSSEVTTAGAQRNNILGPARRLVTRGVLIDVARHHGVAALERDYEITVGDLDGALESQRSHVTPGDAVLIRTGHLARVRQTGAWSSFTEVKGIAPYEPGIGASCLSWVRRHDIAAVACDNWAVECLHGPESTRYPVHEVGIAHMGLLLGEIFELEALALACAEDGVYDFMLAAGPLPIPGATAGPVNPLAIR